MQYRQIPREVLEARVAELESALSKHDDQSDLVTTLRDRSERARARAAELDSEVKHLRQMLASSHGQADHLVRITQERNGLRKRAKKPLDSRAPPIRLWPPPPPA